MFSPFRLKIVLWFGAVVLVTLLVVRLVSVEMVRRSLYDDLDNSLRAEVQWVKNILVSYRARHVAVDEMRDDIQERSSLNPRKEFIHIFSPPGKEFFRSKNLEEDSLVVHTDLGRPKTIEDFRGQPIRLIALHDSTDVIYIGYPLAEVNDATKEILSSFVYLIPLALMFALGGGMILVSRFVRPIQDLNAYTETMVAQPLDKELPAIPIRTRDEIGDLIGRIHEIVSRMRDSMRQVLGYSSLVPHELRTPLAIIRSQLEAGLEKGVSEGRLRWIIASSYDEVLRLNRVVEDLLSFSKLRAGTMRLEMRETELRGFLEEFRGEAYMLADSKEIHVDLQVERDMLVRVDADRLRQVLFNLLDNAIRHTPRGGRICIGCVVHDASFRLTFADSGEGIPQAALPHLFDPFFQAAHGGGRSSGVGLGLALVASIVQAHHGTIQVDSIEGRGTTFIITLPTNMAT